MENHLLKQDLPKHFPKRNFAIILFNFRLPFTFYKNVICFFLKSIMLRVIVFCRVTLANCEINMVLFR